MKNWKANEFMIAKYVDNAEKLVYSNILMSQTCFASPFNLLTA